MAGEDLESARVTFAGITGDRTYAFFDKTLPSSFPWITGRLRRDLILFHPRFLSPPPVEQEIPDESHFAMEVVTPEGEKFFLTDAKFMRHLEERLGRGLGLKFSERSITDSRPVSLFGMSTIRLLSKETGIDLDPLRFRANFYVGWESDEPFYEDQLVGCEIQIGEKVTVKIVKKDSRCVIITLDPATASPSPVVLEKVARNHGGCAGVYGAVLQEGIVRAGDPVYLL